MAIKRAAGGGQIFISDKELNEKVQERKLYKIGVSFDSEKRILVDWKVAE